MRSENRTVSEYIDHLKSIGYPDARSDKRMILVLQLLAGNSTRPGSQELFTERRLVQINLSPSSRKSFEKYHFQQSFNVAIGTATLEAASRMTLGSATAKKGDMDWAYVTFSAS